LELRVRTVRTHERARAAEALAGHEALQRVFLELSRRVRVYASKAACAADSAGVRAFAIEILRAMRATSIHHGHACALDRGSPIASDVDSGGPAVMERVALFRPVTLRRHLSMALPFDVNRG